CTLLYSLFLLSSSPIFSLFFDLCHLLSFPTRRSSDLSPSQYKALKRSFLPPQNKNRASSYTFISYSCMTVAANPSILRRISVFPQTINMFSTLVKSMIFMSRQLRKENPKNLFLDPFINKKF